MRFVEDGALAYPRVRRRFALGEALRLDAAYRLAHLPLVAPAHPDVIPARPDADYRDGRYATPRRSLVVPVPDAVLQASEPFQALDRAVRGSALAAKVAWEVMARRQGRLHLTLAAGLDGAETAAVAACFKELAPIGLRLGGPFVGDRNLGRIYLAGYPELRDGRNLFDVLQEAAGRPATGLYLLGYYNLTDHLDPAETAVLAALLAAHEQATTATLAIERLWLLETNDDLALSARVVSEL